MKELCLEVFSSYSQIKNVSFSTLTVVKCTLNVLNVDPLKIQWPVNRPVDVHRLYHLKPPPPEWAWHFCWVMHLIFEIKFLALWQAVVEKAVLDAACWLFSHMVHQCCSRKHMMMLLLGSKCQRIRDLLSSGGCASGNTNGQQSADRRTNAEGVTGYNQVLQSLSEEHAVFKAGMGAAYSKHLYRCANNHDKDCGR